MNIPAMVSGWLLAVAFMSLWVQSERDHAAEIEACNTRIESAARERERKARQAVQEAFERERVRLSRLAKAHENARSALAERVRELEHEPERVRTVIREVPRETEAGNCLDVPVPQRVLDSLRDNAGGS